jgi:hypothetical protein
VKTAVQTARLVRSRSDEFDQFDLANEVRDLANQEVNAWPKLLTTTDATLTSGWSDVLPANSVGDFMLTAVGRTSTGASVAAYRRRIAVQRVAAGAVAFVGVQDSIGTDKETAAAWDATFAIDAAQPTMLFACVQGAAATTIEWRLHIEGTVSPWV